MCDKLSEKIRCIAKKAGSNIVAVITPHMKFIGELYLDEEGKYKCLVTLKNVKVVKLGCDGVDKVDHEHEWLNINPEHVVAFTVLK